MAEKTNDFYGGLRYGLSMLLQLPDFIFPTKVGNNGTLGLLWPRHSPQLPPVEHHQGPSPEMAVSVMLAERTLPAVSNV